MTTDGRGPDPAHPPGPDGGLRLAGAPNARDLGGLPAADGLRVRPGVLVRTGALGRLTDRDLTVLGPLRVSLLLDLRHGSEIAAAPPDRIPAGWAADVRHVPLFDPEHPVFTFVSAVLLGHNTAAYPGLREEGSPGAMIAIYRWFVADPRARDAFATAVRAIADAGGAPVLYHCSAGKDRTGWLTAILLTALGADRSTVVADYLATNDLSHESNIKLVNAMRAKGLAVDPAVIGPVLEAREAYLAAAYDEVADRFGDMDDYLRAGLGLTDTTLRTLRKNLLRET